MTPNPKSKNKSARSASERAKTIPRDKNGRFVTKITYVIIDDFGDVVPYSKKEPTFGYAVTTTDKMDEVQKIAINNRNIHKTKKEIKASKDSLWNKIHMTMIIKQAEFDTDAYYIDKKRPPHGWDVEKLPTQSKRQNLKNKTKVRNNMLDHVITESVKNLEGSIEVIVDYHSGNKKIHDKCIEKSNKKRCVSGNQYKSEDMSKENALYANALQVNDYVTNAAGSSTKGFNLRSKYMGTKIRRMREWERIK